MEFICDPLGSIIKIMPAHKQSSRRGLHTFPLHVLIVSPSKMHPSTCILLHDYQTQKSLSTEYSYKQTNKQKT